MASSSSSVVPRELNSTSSPPTRFGRPSSTQSATVIEPNDPNSVWLPPASGSNRLAAACWRTPAANSSSSHFWYSSVPFSGASPNAATWKGRMFAFKSYFVSSFLEWLDRPT